MHSIMERCMKTQSQRKLSLKGKTIVINTLILSKLWFIAYVFPVLKDLIPKTNKVIFGYLWRRSAAKPISRIPSFSLGTDELSEYWSHLFKVKDSE